MTGETRAGETGNGENMTGETVILAMTAEHIPAVQTLERLCFSDAWTEGMLKDMLEGEYDACLVMESCRPGGSGGVKTVIGYANVRVLGDEAELMRICIAPEYRGRGLSARLLEEGMGEMLRRGALSATLEVRAGNVPAVRLYESHGFVKEGVRKNYYRDPVEDALIYWNRGLKV